MFNPQDSFLTLYTVDINATHGFYTKLGCIIKEFETNKVVVAIGNFELHFILDTSEPVAEYRYIANAPYGQGFILYIATDDIEASHAVVLAAGGKIKSPIFENHWSCSEFLFEDPNGYKFATYQEIK